jgi:CheY-like chemotaxis protein
MSARILVVDDNADNRKLLVWILEDEGLSYEEAETAEDALAKLEVGNHELVLMDIGLPGMSGDDATRIIRQHPRLHAMPVIAVTAHAIKGEDTRILASGVNALVTKPVDEVRLVALLRQLLPGGAS